MTSFHLTYDVSCRKGVMWFKGVALCWFGQINVNHDVKFIWLDYLQFLGHTSAFHEFYNSRVAVLSIFFDTFFKKAKYIKNKGLRKAHFFLWYIAILIVIFQEHSTDWIRTSVALFLLIRINWIWLGYGLFVQGFVVACRFFCFLFTVNLG